MKQTFEEKLSRIAGKVRRIAIDDPYRRYSGGLLYWSDKAERLHDAAMVLGGDPFGENFEAFALLAGFSLEALIKGTLTGLDGKFPFTHNLVALSDTAGLTMSKNDRTVLQAFTIYTTWSSRYPAAKNAKEMFEAMEVLNAQYPRSGNLKMIADAARTSPVAVNAVNYERLYQFFLQRFFDVQSSVYQSAEFSFEFPEP